MITEEEYQAAKSIVDQYNAEQEALKSKKLKDYNFNYKTKLGAVYDTGLLSSKLYYILIDAYKDMHGRYFSKGYSDPTIGEFKDVSAEDFSKLRGVGKVTLEEYSNLMKSVL